MKSRLFKILATFLCLWTSTWATQAQAYTQCTVTLVKIWAGDGRTVWLHYTNGGAANIAASDANKVSVLSMAMTALVGGRTMTVRYSADGADCTTFGRTDFVGAYLN